MADTHAIATANRRHNFPPLAKCDGGSGGCAITTCRWHIWSAVVALRQNPDLFVLRPGHTEFSRRYPLNTPDDLAGPENAPRAEGHPRKSIRPLIVRLRSLQQTIATNGNPTGRIHRLRKVALKCCALSPCSSATATSMPVLDATEVRSEEISEIATQDSRSHGSRCGGCGTAKLQADGIVSD